MTYEPFHCTFVGDSRGFQVTPEEGTLNRRGGDPQEFDVSYKGNVSRVHCVDDSKHMRSGIDVGVCVNLLLWVRYLRDMGFLHGKESWRECPARS